MKTLKISLREALSDAHIEELKNYIDDTNFNDFIKIIRNNAKLLGLNDHNEAYDKFFDAHGLSKLRWGRNNSAKNAFIKLFAENDKIDVLTQIVNNNGLISINSLSETGNIFDLCTINGIDFSEEAKTIATWTNSTSASAGPCEMLLKFILKEGYSGKSGDVSIYPGEEMEVKAATIGTNPSGGHAVGQKSNNGVNVRGAWAIYLYLNKYLLNRGDKNSDADKAIYFQKNAGFNEFVDAIKANGLDLKKDAETIVKTIVDAVCFQYNFITNKDNAKNDLPQIESLYAAALNFYNNNKFDYNNALDLVGCIQLYLYYQIEQFDYFFFVAIDQSGNSSNSGNYWFVNNCNTKLLNFDNVCKHINFGALFSPTKPQGRTGKMFFRK